MKKIPVGKTIRRTYGFAFGKYLTLFGIMWFPMLVMGVLGYFIFIPAMKSYASMMHAISALHGQPALPPGFGHMIGMVLFAELIAVFLYLVIRAGIAKEIMGLRTGPRFVYLTLGGAEFRVLGGYILAFLLAYIGIIAIIAVLGIVASVTGIAGSLNPQQGGGVMGGVLFLAMLVVEFLFFYALIRLTFFIVPVAVAEKKFGLLRSWALTRGNFWRVFVILLAVWVPLLVAEFAAIMVLMGGKLAAIFEQATQSGQPPDMQAVMNIYIGVLPYLFFAGIVVFPVVYGMLGAPSVFAYQSLNEEPPQQEAEPTAPAPA